MITDYFRAPDTLARMRASCIGAYLDDLTNTMASAGFAPLTITEHVRSAVQLAECDRRQLLLPTRVASRRNAH